MKFVSDVAFPDADEFMAAEMRGGTYQVDHLNLALSYCKRFRVAIDGGAHVGLWSRMLSQRFETVIAVEPSRDTFEALRHNLDAWHCDNVNPLNVALRSQSGRVSMSLDSIQDARRNTGGRYASNGGDVTAVTIDSWALEILDLLKLDVEGSEFSALAGARATLERCKPVVLVEEKQLGVRYYGQRKDAVQRLLVENDYSLVDSKGCDQVWLHR